MTEQRQQFQRQLESVFEGQLLFIENFAVFRHASELSNQQQTNEVFSEKWTKYEKSPEKEKLYEFQKQWYLTLYGFDSEAALAEYLSRHEVILDAGCGLGYKAAWFAQLSPRTLVIGMDFSEAARHAAVNYSHLNNLFFIQGDIANTGLRAGSVNYVSCDQVIMHTEDPVATFAELVRICGGQGAEIACYFYAKKALPRELLDDYFRLHCSGIENEKLWEMSAQLAVLGQRLSDLQVEIDTPDIPLLGIKGGRYDLQRFIYWNFLKCFWNPQLGMETSIVTNFDWYSPSNARRFSEAEVREIVDSHRLTYEFFHAEESCYSGRFGCR